MCSHRSKGFLKLFELEKVKGSKRTREHPLEWMIVNEVHRGRGWFAVVGDSW